MGQHRGVGKAGWSLPGVSQKGSLIYVEGRLKTDKYEDKGNPRFYTKVVVIGLEFRIVPGGRQNKYPDKPHDNHHIQRKHPLTRIDDGGKNEVKSSIVKTWSQNLLSTLVELAEAKTSWKTGTMPVAANNTGAKIVANAVF